ncbi:hypothetical protein DFH06DRAFT_1472051 [Mycena polygramma]|nr:hypothetical protein DFH06DRAFT_1472051 [Mycena polygramma]
MSSSSCSSNGEQQQQRIPVLAPADVQHAISLIQSAYAPSAATDLPRLVPVAIPLRRSSSLSPSLTTYADAPSTAVSCLLAWLPNRLRGFRRRPRNDASSQSELCKLLVRSLAGTNPASLRAFSPYASFHPPILTVFHRYPPIPSLDVLVTHNDFASGFPRRLRTVFYALESGPTSVECALTRAHASLRRRPRRASGSLPRGRRPGELHSNNPAPGVKIGVALMRQAYRCVPSLLLPTALSPAILFTMSICMHLNTHARLTDVPGVQLLTPAAGHADLFAGAFVRFLINTRSLGVDVSGVASPSLHLCISATEIGIAFVSKPTLDFFPFGVPTATYAICIACTPGLEFLQYMQRHMQDSRVYRYPPDLDHF